MYRLSVLLFAPVLWAQTAPGESYEMRERWDHYVDRTFGWKRLSLVAADSGLGQMFNLRQCTRAPYCFPHRFGGALAGRTTRTSLEFMTGALLHEDIRRRPSQLTGFRTRLMFAIKHAPLARDADGDWRPAYSRYIGTFGAIAATSAWNHKPLRASCLFERFGWSTTSYFQDAIFSEFEPDLVRLGKKMFKTAQARFNKDSK